MGTTIVLFDIIDTPSRVARVAAAKYLRFRRNSPALNASAGEGDAECEENFETGAWGRAAGLPAKGGRPRLKLTGAACEMCATRRRRRGSAARSAESSSVGTTRPTTRVACAAAACLSRSAKAMRTFPYSQTRSTSRMHITMRYPMMAPGSPVKFTNRIGTNSENPNVIR